MSAHTPEALIGELRSQIKTLEMHLKYERDLNVALLKERPLHAAAPRMHEWLTKAVQMADMQYRSECALPGASCAYDAPMPSAWKWLADNARAILRKIEGETR